jgi:hypothetical protein
VPLGHVGDGVRDGRAVGAHHRVDLVLRDQLLVEANGGFRIGAVIADQNLKGASEDAPLFVHVFLAEQVALTDIAALDGVPSSGGDRGADPDRLLGLNQLRHRNDGRDHHGDERE